MNRLTKILGVGVLSLGIMAGTLATSFAADPTPTPQTPPGIAQPCNPGRGFGFGAQAILGPISQLLGIAPEEIAAERNAGNSLAQVAASKGVSEAALLDTMLAAKKAQLDEKVNAGVITQAQADQAYAAMEQRTKESINRTETGPNRSGERLGLGMRLGRGPMGR